MKPVVGPGAGGQVDFGTCQPYLPFPQVMQFRVQEQQNALYSPPATLSPSFRKVTASDLPGDTMERFAVLSFDKTGGMPQIWEMQEVPADTAPGDGIVTVEMPGGTKTLRRTGTRTPPPSSGRPAHGRCRTSLTSLPLARPSTIRCTST